MCIKHFIHSDIKQLPKTEAKVITCNFDKSFLTTVKMLGLLHITNPLAILCV